MPKVPVKIIKTRPPEKKEPVVHAEMPLNDDGLRIISYSEMDAFRQCPLKHQLSYKERWKRPVVEGSPLARGSLFHLVMETHYGVIKDISDRIGGREFTPVEESDVLAAALAAVRPLLADQQSGLQTGDQELIQWMYEGYVEKYGADNEWRIIAIEYPFELNLPDADGNPSPYWLKGKIDLLAQRRSDGGLWIWDHKSGKDLPSAMSLEIDDQFGGYSWALKVLGYNVRGSMHNGVRTTRNKGDYPGAILNGSVKKQTLEQRNGRTYLNRGVKECENLALDFWAAAVNAYPEESGFPRLPLYSSPDPRSCGWKCDFKEIHLIARSGQDIHDLLREYRFTQDFTRH